MKIERPVKIGSSIALALALASCAADPPPAPVLSVSVALKALDFTWSPAAGAERYELVLDLEEGAEPSRVALGPGQTRYTQEIAVHRVDWASASARLDACNEAGCSSSALVTLAGRSTEAVGYFKATQPRESDWFGVSAAISADGRTLAIGAGSVSGYTAEGRVYAFTRDSGGWGQAVTVRGRPKASNDGFGGSVALSSTGQTLVVGAPLDYAGAETHMTPSGAVYVFERIGGAWREVAYLKASNAQAWDMFGQAVAIDASGSRLAVGAPQRDGDVPGVPGGGWNSGMVYVFVRQGDAWSEEAHLGALPTARQDARFGEAVAISGDGNTMIVGAPYDSLDLSGHWGAAYTYRRAAGSWAPLAPLAPAVQGTRSEFGSAVAVSDDGATLAVGAPSQTVDGEGTAPQIDMAGAVHVFELGASGNTWNRQAQLKAPSADPGDLFGLALALSGDGNTVAVGARCEDAASTGIGGPQGNNAEDSGAAYVWTRRSGVWTRRAYVKASNTGERDAFGWSLGLSRDGGSLAVGAAWERSASRGIGGNQADDSLLDAGAVYLY